MQWVVGKAKCEKRNAKKGKGEFDNEFALRTLNSISAFPAFFSFRISHFAFPM